MAQRITGEAAHAASNFVGVEDLKQALIQHLDSQTAGVSG